MKPLKNDPPCPFCGGPVAIRPASKRYGLERLDACADPECKGAHGWTWTLPGPMGEGISPVPVPKASR